MPSFRSSEHHEEERLSAFLDDELSEEQALRVTRHLRACERCLGELEGLRSTRSALRGLPAVEPPAVLFDGVASAAASYDLGLRRTWRIAAAAAAATALIAAVAFVAGEDGGTVSPPVELFVVDHVTRVGDGPMLTPVDMGPNGP